MSDIKPTVSRAKLCHDRKKERINQIWEENVLDL